MVDLSTDGVKGESKIVPVVGIRPLSMDPKGGEGSRSTSKYHPVNCKNKTKKPIHPDTWGAGET